MVDFILVLELAKQANKQRNKNGKIITRRGNEGTFCRMEIHDNKTIKSSPINKQIDNCKCKITVSL